MAQPLPREQSLPVAFLSGAGLLTGMEGALNPDVKNEAEQFKQMFRALDEDRQERILAQARGGRVLKQVVLQIYKEWQAEQARKPTRGALDDTTGSDLA